MSLQVFDADWQDLYNLLVLPTAPVSLRANGCGPAIPGVIDVVDVSPASLSSLLNDLEINGLLEPMAPLIVLGNSDKDIAAVIQGLQSGDVMEEVLSLNCVHRVAASEAEKFVEEFPVLLENSQARALLPSRLHCLSPQLYLGDRDCAANEIAFDMFSLDWVVNCTTDVPCEFRQRARYLQIAVQDDPEVCLLEEFGGACDFIAEAIGKGGNVLVHCWAGVSRSSSIVLAYAIRDLGFTLEGALEAVRRSRWCVRPNEGFVKQLKAWESMVRLPMSGSIAMSDGCCTPRRKATGPTDIAAELDDALVGLGLAPVASDLPVVLRIITWNVWFDQRARLKRWLALLREALSCDPHIVCLQEVTEELMDIIAASKHLRSRFCLSGPLESSYDCVMLVRRDLRARFWAMPLPTSMGRRCLVADIEAADGLVVRVATVHLESQAGNETMRRRQVETVFPAIRAPIADTSKSLASVVICGDFNICSSWAENQCIVATGFADVWPLLRGSDPGFTEDTCSNEMLLEAKGRHKQVRFDRILMMSCRAAINAMDIQLLGTSPFAAELWPSDHFGLCAQVEMCKGSDGQ